MSKCNTTSFEIQKKESMETMKIEEPSTKHRGWKAMPYIVGNEMCERLGSLGTSANLLVYLTTIFHMSSVTATNFVNVFNGTSNLAPVVGAFLSDTYIGRCTTLGFASVASFLGMFILTLTAAIPNLHPPTCSQSQQYCATPTHWHIAVLLSAFSFMVVGSGGIRPCSLAFGADQFDPNTDSGRKGINSFFNWYYFIFTFSMMISVTVIVYVQSDVSWSLGLAIPTVMMFFSCAFFFTGMRIYVKVKPEGSPFTSIARVLAAAFRKRRLEICDETKESLYSPPHASTINSKLPHTDQFRFLDKAAIIEPNDINKDGFVDKPWRLCTFQQVEEVKCILRIIPVWSALLMFNVATIQHQNYIVFQAEQSDRHLFHSNFQIPAGSFIVITMLSLTIWIPIYDRVVVPRLRRFFGNIEGFTLLQRMGIGIVLSIITMVTAGIVEEKRRSYVFHRPTIGIASGGGEISSLSSLWMIPQLALFGVAEAFGSVGQIEFYYKQFPENMRSIAGSLFFCSIAISNYLSGFMVTIVNRTTNWLAQDLNMGRLDYFYFVIAGMGVLSLVYFIAWASWYRYKEKDGPSETALEVNEANTPPV